MNTDLHHDLVRKYAFAYLNIFCKSLSRDDLQAIMQLYDFLHAQRRVTFFLKLSAIDDRIKFQELAAVCDRYNAPDSIKKLIALLLEHKRCSLLVPLLRAIVVLHKECVGIHTFTISSSHALSDQEREKIETFIAKQTGDNNIYNYSVDKNLIAGVRAQSKTFLWEHSIAKQLRQMELSLIG